MKTDRTQEKIAIMRGLIAESCGVLVEAARMIWEDLDTNERSMLRGYVVAQEWEVPQHPAMLRTFLGLVGLGLVTHDEATGGAAETTVFADAMISIMDSEGEHGLG